ncbi:killer cell lectin-like receptor 4 [Chionomys nivalis]|uniref:killer cell lectin-like receptor 4 n=1 Tax=Chionomys nivalis TaxID=269649 RepID=UPI002592EA4D|nr:killer cell lectin-like receptor 4 [Chionomys nivalis]
MRNQHVIYSNSRVFESSSESQSPASQDETHGSREVCQKVALGILCLLLMTAIAVWLTYSKCAEARLFCCGIKCYYFIMDNKPWKDCKQTCQDCSLSLLKIDDDDELKFLKYQFTTNSFWIGLSYEISKSKWEWIDNGTSKLLLPTAKEASLTKVENSYMPT